MFNYDLGEMKTKDGMTLWHQIDRVAVKYAMTILHSIKALPVYGELIRRLPSDREPLYLFDAIKNEIYPFIFKGCVIQWHCMYGKGVGSSESVVRIPRQGVVSVLEELWDLESVPIEMVDSFSTHILFDDTLRRFASTACKGKSLRCHSTF